MPRFVTDILLGLVLLCCVAGMWGGPEGLLSSRSPTTRDLPQGACAEFRSKRQAARFEVPTDESMTVADLRRMWPWLDVDDFCRLNADTFGSCGPEATLPAGESIELPLSDDAMGR